MPETARQVPLRRRPDGPALVPVPDQVATPDSWTSSGRQPWRKVRCACGRTGGEVYGKFDPAVCGVRVRCKDCREMVRLA